MRKILLVAQFIFLISLSYSYSQGCVAIRGNTNCNGNIGNTTGLNKGEFNAQLGYRHFKSFRHFRGDTEESHRLEEGTEVINNSSFFDFSLSYAFTNRFYVNAIIPFVKHTRTSMYEHGGNPPSGLGERHETSSHGLSDIRFGVGYWLFDPSKHNFNYSIGLGIKLPTGSYEYTDLFYNQGENRNKNQIAVVDQSIMPGDGGTGVTLDIQGFHRISHNFNLSSNLFYLFNFQETNGVLTRYGSSEFSCADQYAARLGGSYSTNSGFNFYLGGRVEGVPASDIIGGSAGYRRPGYAISLEPGVGYAIHKFSVFASLPIALYRNRIQSYQDKVRTQNSGTYRHGDAAFADYLINVGVSYNFGGNHSKEDM